jgi:hypothetical protein
LQERGAALGRPATLDDVTDQTLDEIAARSFSWVWWLGVWQTGEAARRVSRSNPTLREGFKNALPDLREEDIVGSPFAVKAWETHTDFGGDAALARMRKRLADRGLKLLLDFVPNHVAPDHPWVVSHPEFFVRGTDEDLAREPQNYLRVNTGRGSMVLAYGRDPYFAGWPDTLQLNYRHAGLREAQVQALARIAERCDGVRCDMARRSSRGPGVRGRGRSTARHPWMLPSGRRPSLRSGAAVPASCSWPRSTGTWSGSCNKPGSTTPATNASTISSSSPAGTRASAASWRSPTTVRRRRSAT